MPPISCVSATRRQQRIVEGIAAGLTAFQKSRPPGTDQK
jgi:hypothetical protein